MASLARNARLALIQRCFAVVAVAGAWLALTSPSAAQNRRPTDAETTKTRQPDKGEKDRDEKAAGKVDLRPKFTKGNKLIYKMDIDSKSKTKMPALDDADTVQNTKQELGLVFLVKDVTDDGTIVELTFNTMKMTQETGTGKDKDKVEFDSNRPKATDKDNPLAPGCRELVGSTFTITIDKDGQVTNVAGGGGLTSLGAIGMPGGIGNIGGQSTGLGGSSQGFADAIGSIFSIKKGSLLVNVGERWSTSDEIDSGLLGQFRMITDSTLKSHSGNIARVKINGRIEPATGRGGNASMFKLKDSLYLGEYLWDTKAGALKSLEVDQNVSIDGDSSGGINMTASSKMKVSRVR
ncbi:MAG: DUF6263 family protein [Phycisphaerales bacterium]